MSEVLQTTSVGSFPKPEYLTKARAAHSKGTLSDDELYKLEMQATKETIALQEELGIDILVDGEMYRGDMATYFAENMDGFEISGLVRSYGNRYYRKPIITGEIKRPRPITIERWKTAQALTKKPMKAILTGPYTMMDWSFDEHYPSRREACLALARALHLEVKDLEAAGATHIQIDEPAISVRVDEFDVAIEAMKIVTEGIKVKTYTHICYGTFELIYPRMLDLAVDQIDLEMACRNFDLLDHFAKTPFTKEIGFGVTDVHSHKTESADFIADGLRRALKYIPADRLYVDPDCGLKTRTWDEAKAKLEVMMKAVKQVRSEIGASRT
jgi:5-methyltetrahydropteroyltriglutamate--homocysteine methyltransferase